MYLFSDLCGPAAGSTKHMSSVFYFFLRPAGNCWNVYSADAAESGVSMVKICSCACACGVPKLNLTCGVCTYVKNWICQPPNTSRRMRSCMPGWLAGGMAGWLAAWLAGWLAGGLAGWLAGCLAKLLSGPPSKQYALSDLTDE